MLGLTAFCKSFSTKALQLIKPYICIIFGISSKQQLPGKNTQTGLGYTTPELTKRTDGILTPDLGSFALFLAVVPIHGKVCRLDQVMLLQN